MEGMPEEKCSLAAVAAELAQIHDMAKQLVEQVADPQQGGGDGDAAAGGGYQRVRELTSTICANVDKALHMLTSNSLDGSPAAGQPESTPSSGGHGSSRGAVLDSDQAGGGTGNAPGQGKDRKTLSKWSTQVRVSNAQDATYLDDGFIWRKYGQKDILGAKHPRGYYRCTHRHMQGCLATKQIQRTDGDPLLLDVVYIGSHTCTQPWGAAAHPNIQSMLPTTEQTTTSGSESGSVLTSEIPGSMASRKRDTGGETRLSKTMIEEPHSTPYKDVMAWFSMGKLRQKGRLSHTCMQQAGQELLGRDDIRQQVMEKILLDRNGVNNCTVICIYGWSGLGKTSLLHALYNDQQLLDAFDKRIWIQISDKIDISMLFRKIVEFAMNEHCSITNIDFLRELVVEEITDKKFLLFLDDADIVNQQFWTTLLEVLNTGAKGSVVVMATRSSTVAAVRNVATHSYSLNPLSEENNLMLLQQYAVVGTDIQSNPDLALIANRFISRFRYNLLHLKAIGGLLCHTDTFSVEKDKFEGSVMPLWICHDVLPVHLKRCLALCSLFPEGYIFGKHHMVLLWISHGCVRPVEGYELEDVGVEYFNELLCRSFFQCSPVHSDKNEMFVMHELMYKVVESVSPDKYFKSEDPVISIPENVFHCSLITSQFQTVELMHRMKQLKHLQTFMVVQPEWKPNNISLPTLNLVGLDDFFLKFTSLETLDLSHTETEELPASIAGLRNLRYLSVNSTNVRALPCELCSLSNLQTLEAKHCRFLTELPRDIKMLVKLRHLDLTKELGYVDLPHGIGELIELQTLPVFHVSGDSSCCSISELGSLHNLRGCLWLSGLESVKTGSKAKEANLKDKHCLNDLTLQWHDDGIDIEDEGEDSKDVADEQVLEGLKPHVNLQVLTIRGYEGRRFPAWMQGSSPSLPNLVTLTLDNCCNCTEFPTIVQLPSLKSLSVRKMYDVQQLSSHTDTHGNGSTAKFPSLELLNLWEMYGLEELFSKESEGDCPRLRKVCISRCPDLRRLPSARSLTELVLHCGKQLPDISELASLVSLKIEGFHGTKSFGLPAAAALRKLEIRSCKELASVDGLSAVLTTVQRLKIAGCPKLVLPGRNQ
ncbi:disease resistance protein RGA2 [Sorghum bicolor]|uniref:WRKY domain-containing protein n=1 Tax=Sorghum bicolor TaxID=4558 RepID=A0A1B6PKB6_SORBI|nr:disease resistance protein RGA2 [Sorghum bicolor]XP_021319591.1 disease resistance protein RGA2 [Sorghum bicolor]XP_021319592.1 disease resistance protein RGA2 [Sorghum bicolor]KXG26110.1 hypothetical protein SORBI_3006G051700 [Sorghum bicolor]OQU81396.1 hypothetical protein SORBI_3006G051700 [Sorghum bicolor]|eukprot:XP_021319590.1 disease resistance protein RGA2 [Sorghum bicolor]